MKKIIGILVFILFVVYYVPSSYGQFFLLFRNPVIGKEAPDMALKDLAGNSKTISEMRNGKNTVLFFWATWCPHCRKAIIQLNNDKQKFEENNVALILVNLGENRYIVNKYISKNNINLNILSDVDSKLAEPYGVTGLPTFFYINKKGIVIDSNHSVSNDYMKIFNKSSK